MTDLWLSMMSSLLSVAGVYIVLPSVLSIYLLNFLCNRVCKYDYYLIRRACRGREKCFSTTVSLNRDIMWKLFHTYVPELTTSMPYLFGTILKIMHKKFKVILPRISSHDISITWLRPIQNYTMLVSPAKTWSRII